MAFPFLSECGFEDGTKGHFDTETDTESRLDFPHYAELARIPGIAMPYRGAYCLRLLLANDGSPADAYLQETGSWDLSASGSIYFRFFFWVSPNIVMANADEFGILELWSGTNTVEAGVFINYTTANGLRIGIGETAATQLKQLSTGKWHCFELKCVIDSGVGNDGTIDAWLDGEAYTQVGTLDQGAITSGIFGCHNQDAGTTTGTILFDDIVADDARLGLPTERFPMNQLMTKDGHAFLGPGCITRLDLQSGAGTDNVVTVYDTDRAYTTDPANAVLELKNTESSETVQGIIEEIYVKRGAYVVMTGTNPRVTVAGEFANNMSEGGLRSYARGWRPHPSGA